MRVIFVPVSDRPECVVALRSAFNLGKLLDASITGCHIRAHRDSSIALLNDNSDKDNVVLENNASAKSLFSRFSEDHDYKFSNKPKSTAVALWLEKIGSPEKLFSIMGPVSDLIIVSRPAKKGKSLARRFMMSALLNSARPVIILPQLQAPTIGKRISIAWNQSTQAASAVAAAMPLLCQADKVNIITCGPENRTGPKSKHLKKYLNSWGIKAKHVKAKGDNETQALINGFNETKSDLLVMGGYSRNRLKQRIFGGVTEFMIQQANIPVLMLHIG